MRAVAQADGSVGRIVDGHYNAVERIELLAPSRCAAPTSRRSRPAGDGWACGAPTRRPARASRRAIVRNGDGCASKASRPSARAPAGSTARSWWRATATRGASPTSISHEGVEIDRAWFAAAGMRASESHLVRFHGAPVHALLGGPDELLREPWFGARRHPHGRDLGGHRRRGPRRGARGARAARARRRRPRRAGRRRASTRTRRRSTCGWPRPGGARTPTRRRDRACRCTCARRSRAPRRRSSTRRCAPPARARCARRRPGPRAPRPAHLPAPAPARPAARARRTRGGRPVTLRARPDFEARYAADPDPWDFETSAYEHDKYDAHARGARRPPLRRAASSWAARSACSPRCSPSAATSCSRVDIAQAAVDAARERLGRRRTCASSAARCPAEWPAGPFDLVVCSEVLYYLDAPALEAALDGDRARWPRAGACSPSTGARRDARSADRRRRPRAAARAPGAARHVEARAPTTSFRSTSSAHEARRSGSSSSGAARPRCAAARGYREAGGGAHVDAHLRRAAPALPAARR